MSTGSAYLTVRGLSIDVEYKDIKHLHIGVYPPVGRVRVAAPRRLSDDDVRLAVIQRLPWIKRQRAKLKGADRQSEREMVTGESHYVWGLRYRLKVVERPGRGHVELDSDRLVLYIAEDVSSEQRRGLLDQWYRNQLRAALPHLIGEWEPTVGVSVSKWSIRRMKTRWGSCKRDTGHLWFNVELAKKHPRCLEYIVVHEMAHLRERSHGAIFTELMNQFLPDWRSRRDQLNAAPLGHEEWTKGAE